MSGEIEPEAAARRIEITVTADRRGAEALSLEVRRLAKSCGLEIGAARILPASDGAEERESRGSG